MNKSFRINTKKVFLTYPQSKLNKETIFNFILNTKPVNRILVAEEEHKDGNPHFHAYVVYKNRIDIRNPKYFDINGEHGNYQSMKREWECLNYCMKYDPEPKSNFNHQLFIDSHLKHNKDVKNKLMLDDLLEKKPINMLQEGSLSWRDYKKAKEFLEEYYIDLENEKKNQEKIDLGEELENNWNLNLTFNLESKQCHFWIWSKEPNRGKTTWLNSLYQKYRSNFLNLTEKFQNHLSGQEEILMLDEYRAQLLVSQLNMICDGTYFFPRKNLPALKMKHRCLIIICSNLSPDECYPNTFQFIEKRFNIINID